MENRKIIISALLFFLSYAQPALLCWLVFLFLVPLFLLQKNHGDGDGKGFFWGCMWGLLFYGIHLYPIADVLYYRGQGDYRIIMYVLLIGFFSLHSGLWFWCVQKLQRHMPLLAWPFVTFTYFVWIQTSMLWVFGICEGYPFALPIIPLGEYTGFLFLLPWLGVYGLTVCLICAQWSFVQYTKRGRYSYVYGLIAVCCYGVFAIGFIIPEGKEPALPNILQHILYISPSYFDVTSSAHPMDCTQEVAYALQKGVEQSQNKDHPICFIFPESTFPFITNQHNYDAWQHILDNNEAGSLEMVIGAHKKGAETTHNCLFHLNSRRIIQTYEKNHAFIFTERIPFYLKGFTFFLNLFGGNTDRSNKADNSSYSLLIKVHTHYVLPVLCSELFCNDFSSLPFKKVPILLLCNDNWFSTNQIKNLMLLYAKIYAMLHQRPIIYISHLHGTFFPKTGRAKILPTIA